MNISVDNSLAAPFVEAYNPTPGVYDEMSSAPGIIRPGWESFISSISGPGSGGMARNRRNVRIPICLPPHAGGLRRDVERAWNHPAGLGFLHFFDFGPGLRRNGPQSKKCKN